MKTMRMMAMGAMVLMTGSLARAGVDKSIQNQYVSILEGRTVVAKVDVKVLKIKKMIRGDQMRGMGGVDHAEMTKDATEITTEGVRYKDEAGARESLFASRGTPLVVDEIDFGRDTIEVTVKREGSREKCVITFVFDKKLDASFDRAQFDQMWQSTFVSN